MRAAARFSKLAWLCVVSFAVTVGCAQLLGLKEDVPPTPCVLNSDCSPNELCIFRVCSAACKLDKDCLPGSRCLDTNGSAACVVSTGAACSAAADGGDAACPDGTVCDATNTCRNSCASCHDDQTCVNDVCVGTDPTHDPGATGTGGSSGTGGTSGETGGTGTAGGNVGNGGRVGTGGTTGAGGKGTTTGGSTATGEAGAPSVVVSCGDTAVGDKIACNAKPDGAAINFPGGKPQGPCAAGTMLCGADGMFGPCMGAVAPGASDCTSSADNDCDGKPDNTECGLCTVGATQYCYDAAAATVGVGACKSGTQVCQLDSTKTATVWGPCAGEITPAPNDTCDTGNDATCNKVPNEGCNCINGDSGTCGSKLQLLGNCGAGTTKCSGGNWGACSIAPKAADTCDLNDDGNCNGVVNQGCACINGGTVSCGTSGMGCTLGTETCASGAYGACAGNSCVDFAVTPPATKCTASGPNGEDVVHSCTIGVCQAGYHVTDCSLSPSALGADCSFDGANSANSAAADVTTTKAVTGTSSSCTFTACNCRLNGF